jgi:hypothetical protein
MQTHDAAPGNIQIDEPLEAGGPSALQAHSVASDKIDSLTLRAISVEADADPRSVRREIREPGSVRGRPGERIRAVLSRRGIRPSGAA